MSHKIFTTDQIDFIKEPLFFGTGVNIARYDTQHYPIFEKITQTQLGFFWRPEEINLTKDVRDFKKLNESEKHIFLSNIKYQILLDSVQGRSPFIGLLPHVTVPELEVCIGAWGFFEQIHSRSYTYIIRTVFSQSSSVFDSILDIPEIVTRAVAVTKYYDDFIEYTRTLTNTHNFNTDPQLYRLLIKMLVSIYILEGIRFYVSFACSFAFGENELMEGNAKILALIARDENIHLSITSNIIKIMKTDNELFLNIYQELESEIIEMFRVASDQEKEWARYLFRDGSIIGLNEKLLAEYVDYIVCIRMKTLGFKPLVNQTINPLSWMSKWLNSKNKQPALQETEQESYLIGAINMDIDNNALNGFEL